MLDVGYEVRCLARDPARLDAAPFHGQVKVVEGDVVSGAGLDAAVEGGRRLLPGALAVAVRLPPADQTAAKLVVQAAADAGASRVVYLGGLRPRREDVPSRRLASRAEVGDVFLRGAVPAAVLQAGMITGSGVDQLRDGALSHRPAACDDHSSVGAQPHPADRHRRCAALPRRCSTLPRETNRTFDVGGPDVLTYMDMMQRYARIAGLPRRLALPVPAFTSWLSSWWVALVTPVSQALRSFFQSDRWSHPCLDTPLVSAATPGRPASRP